MATQTTTRTSPQSQNRAQSQRGRKGNRGRGGSAPSRGGRGGGRGGSASGNLQSVAALEDKAREAEAKQVSVGQDAEVNGSGDAEGEDICFICAEPIKYYSVSQCGHRTCHVCSLRLRALYKKLDCTFCKVSTFLFALLLLANLVEPV